MNSFGEHIKITVFGESCGPAVGVVLDGLPAGESIDAHEINTALHRRPPGSTELGTALEEACDAVITTGVFEGITTGAPICVLIRNNDSDTAVNKREILRPGTADMAAFIKYKGCADYRGGGPFGTRLTAPIIVAGEICRQLLSSMNICIKSHVVQVGAAKGEGMDTSMKKEILDCRGSGDSIGSIAQCSAYGIPAGTGGLMFSGLDSRIAAMLYALPGIKAVEFGAGFGFAEMRGSEANDAIELKNAELSTITNHSGGITGGISNGMPLTLRCALRPTPSISREQQTVDVELMENISVRLRGRQDPCLAPRALPAIEGTVAFCVLDAILENGWHHEPLSPDGEEGSGEAAEGNKGDEKTGG